MVTTIVGIFLLYQGCWILKQSRDALSWPQTKGHMIEASLAIDHLPKFIDTRQDPARWYGTEVRYEYTVADQMYVSDRLSFDYGGNRNPKEALKVLHKYRQHHEVPVYYNPKDPNESVLEPGNVDNVYLLLVIGGLLAFMGIFAFYGRSLEYNPKKENYIHQGDVYQNQEKFEEAILQYSYAISANPSVSQGYSRRGGVYLQLENWDRAIADFSETVAIDPKDAVAYFALGKAFLGKGRYDLAGANMQKAMDNGFNVDPGIMESIKRNL